MGRRTAFRNTKGQKQSFHVWFIHVYELGFTALKDYTVAAVTVVPGTPYYKAQISIEVSQ